MSNKAIVYNIFSSLIFIFAVKKIREQIAYWKYLIKNVADPITYATVSEKTHMFLYAYWEKNLNITCKILQDFFYYSSSVVIADKRSQN